MLRGAHIWGRWELDVAFTGASTCIFDIRILNNEGKSIHCFAATAGSDLDGAWMFTGGRGLLFRGECDHLLDRHILSEGCLLRWLLLLGSVCRHFLILLLGYYSLWEELFGWTFLVEQIFSTFINVRKLHVSRLLLYRQIDLNRRSVLPLKPWCFLGCAVVGVVDVFSVV